MEPLISVWFSPETTSNVDNKPMKIKVLTLLKYAAEEIFFCLFKRTSVVWVSPRPGSLMEARQGLTQGSRGGTVQKAVLINGVNSCANIYLFALSPLEHWLILRILKTEVFIIDIRSNTFKVRSNGNFMCLLLCMCIQPITKMNYSSYEKKNPPPSFITTNN